MTTPSDDDRPTRPDDGEAEEVQPSGHEGAEDGLADEMSEESFPSSDPPSTWAGPAD